MTLDEITRTQQHTRHDGLRLLAGVALVIAGFMAFAYAHYHDPTPGADPMAVHLLSTWGYQLLHYGAIVAMAGGALLGVWALLGLWRNPL